MKPALEVPPRRTASESDRIKGGRRLISNDGREAADEILRPVPDATLFGMLRRFASKPQTDQAGAQKSRRSDRDQKETGAPSKDGERAAMVVQKTRGKFAHQFCAFFFRKTTANTSPNWPRNERGN